jgi:hypothetical protein
MTHKSWCSWQKLLCVSHIPFHGHAQPGVYPGVTHGLSISETFSQYKNRIFYGFDMTGNTDSLKKGRIKKTSQYLIVACGMLYHSSSMAVQSCWISARTETSCRTHQSGESQTCSMGDMSGEYAGHGRTGTFSASRKCVQVLATWGCALSWWNVVVMAADEWHDNGPQDLLTVSLCI